MNPTALAAIRSADSRRRTAVVLVLVGTVLALATASLGLGTVGLSPGQVLAGLRGTDPTAAFIVTGLRLPRLALGLAVGGALGLAGALLQSVVRNPLASPDIVGVTGGASATAVLAIAAGATGTAVDGAALVGALGAATAVVLLSGRGVTGDRFVVVGVAVGFLTAGVLGYALTRASLTQARSAFFWLVGSVGSAPWEAVGRVAVALVLAAVAVTLARRPLAVLALDDDTARSLGSHPAATRTGAILLSSALAAVAVAVAGPVAFVAFVAGPIARRLHGNGAAYGTAGLVGAVVVVAADLIAQHLIPGALQPPVGLVTGALGAPVLLWLLVHGERRTEVHP